MARAWGFDAYHNTLMEFFSFDPEAEVHTEIIVGKVNPDDEESNIGIFTRVWTTIEGKRFSVSVALDRRKVRRAQVEVAMIIGAAFDGNIQMQRVEQSPVTSKVVPLS